MTEEDKKFLLIVRNLHGIWVYPGLDENNIKLHSECNRLMEIGLLKKTAVDTGLGSKNLAEYYEIVDSVNQ